MADNNEITTTAIVPQDNTNPFDAIKHSDTNGNEYWLARELQPLLGYSRWQRFEEVIDRAKLACQNSGSEVQNHFIGADNLVERSQGGGSKQVNYKLSRYACYLTAMNGDVRKVEIAAAQNYFAVQTRIAEITSNNINVEDLSNNIATALEKALAPINQRLNAIEQQLSSLPGNKSKRPWTLSASTPIEEVPQDYIQLEDSSWLSPEAYEAILKQNRRQLPWEIRKLRDIN